MLTSFKKVDNFLHKITIIPARGGSKGIPKKNLQIINEKSLVERAVISALKIPNNSIYVSSDDDIILKRVAKYDINICKRSLENSSDFASSESVVLEVLERIPKFHGIITLLQPTSPFIDIDGWRKALDYLARSKNVHSMFSAVEKNQFIWELDQCWKPVNHEKSIRVPRQFKPLSAVETGSFYLFKSDNFKKEQTRFCGTTEPAFTKIWSDFDIDNQEDLMFCRDLSKIIDFPPYLR